jgi:hypothetical protein
MAGCATKAPTPTAKIYREAALVKPGSYHLSFLLDGRDTLGEYLLREKARNPELRDFEISGLERLFRGAFPQLYLPVQPGAPLCNLETHFKHCRGIELLTDLEAYPDETILLHGWVFYHVRLRLEGDQPNFFRAAKAQRDRGEFALPRHYYVGSLVEAIRKALPILQEIATDYGKYIKNDDQEIEIQLILEESRERAAARKSENDMKDTAEFSGSLLLSALPSLSFPAGLTISALHSGGKTFWEVLKEKKEFDIYKRRLDLDRVGFSYTESFSKNFSHFLLKSGDPSDILIRGITVRLVRKEETTPSREGLAESPAGGGPESGPDEGENDDAE